MFKNENETDHKCIDLAPLPPCQSVLYLHAKRANTVAYLWQQSLSAQIAMPDYSICGWNVSCDIQWVDILFPEVVEDVLINEEYDNDGDEYGRDTLSEDERDEDEH